MKDIVWMALAAVLLCAGSIGMAIWSPRVEIAYTLGLAGLAAAVLSLRE